MVILWTAVAAAAACISALAAGVYTFLTYRLVAAQGEPKVVVFACSDPDRQTVIMIKILNIGRDVATDIRFTSSRPIPSHAFGLTTSGSKAAATSMTDGPLVEGIPVLGPGDSREITWGQYGGLMNSIGDDPVELTYSYHHGRRRLRGRSRLEVKSFTATDDSQKPAEAASRSLDQIAKAVDSIAKDVHRLRG